MKRPLQHVVRVCLFLGCSGLLPFLCISLLRWSFQASIPDPSNPITSPSERGLPGFNTDPSTTTSCEDCSLPARRLATDHHADADATLTSSPAPAFWPRNMGNNAGTGSVRPYPHAITRMCVIGERNSGTNWVEKTLNMNFPGAQPLRSGMASSNCYRHKHWFHFPHLMEPLVEDGDLIFVLFRNALDWLLHFSASPHHAHNHHGLPMREFLTRPWTGRPDNDTCATEPRQWMYANPQYERYRAVYGGPYPEGPIRDVLQLRAMKVDNFLRLPQWMPAGHDRVIFLRYEDLIRGDAQGFRNLILELKAHFRIAGLCPKDRMPPLVSMGYKGSDYDPVSLMRLEIGQVHHRQLVNGTALQALEAVQAFRRGAALELEEWIGYTYEYLPSGSN